MSGDESTFYIWSNVSFFSCQEVFLTGWERSAEAGCNLSGDMARLDRGEPGSQLFGLVSDFLDASVGVWCSGCEACVACEVCEACELCVL